MLQDGILNFAIGLSQLPVITFQSWNLHRLKSNFSKRGLAVKGLIKYVEELQWCVLICSFAEIMWCKFQILNSINWWVLWTSESIFKILEYAVSRLIIYIYNMNEKMNILRSFTRTNIKLIVWPWGDPLGASKNNDFCF